MLISTGRCMANAGTMTRCLAAGLVAVRSVFAIQDRYSQIDLEDRKGHTPEKIIGHVELQDVVSVALVPHR
mgnify:FL=1